MNTANNTNSTLPDGNGTITPFPELMTEEELIRYLRINEVSQAGDLNNVIDNLKRMHCLPCIHISRKPLYPLSAVRRWIEEKLEKEQRL